MTKVISLEEYKAARLSRLRQRVIRNQQLASAEFRARMRRAEDKKHEPSSHQPPPPAS